MHRVRASWVALAMVVVVMLAAQPLREQIRAPQPPWEAYYPTTAMEYMIGDLAYPPGGCGADQWLKPYQEGAAAFVSKHYANEAEMLMAAGLLASDAKAGRQLLEQATGRGGSPVAWAAYAGRLMREEGRYQRLAQAGGDPGDPKAQAEAQETLRTEKLPDHLPSQQTAPLLKAVRSWQAADPNNALPVALESYLLYGLHRDRGAFSRLRAASVLPRVTDYEAEISAAMTRLLVRMGASELNARFAIYLAASTSARWALRDCARIALYEGRVAQLQGRPRDAVAWWNAAIGLGCSMQESARTTLEFLVGAAIESVGASPTWRWYLGRVTGLPRGPLAGGRCFYGPQHAFYVGQVGARADAEVRDHLIRSRLRTDLLRGGWFAVEREMLLRNAALLSALASLLGVLTIAFLAFYLAVCTWSCRKAEATTQISLKKRALLASLPIALAVFGLAAPVALIASRRADSESLPWVLLLGCLGASLLLAVLVPLLAGRRTRVPSARLTTVWRGNLRAVLPISIAISSLLYLGLQVTAYGMTQRWVRDSRAWDLHEMAYIGKSLGANWGSPKIPKDAWRAEYPDLTGAREGFRPRRGNL